MSSFFSQSSIISNWPLIQFLSFCICAVWTCRANYFLVHSRVLWNLQLWITSTSWFSLRKDRETSSSIDWCQYPAPVPVVSILIPCPTKFPSTNQSFSEKRRRDWVSKWRRDRKRALKVPVVPALILDFIPPPPSNKIGDVGVGGRL